MDARSTPEIWAEQRAPGSLGPVRPWLVAATLLSLSRRAAADIAYRLSQRLVARPQPAAGGQRGLFRGRHQRHGKAQRQTGRKDHSERPDARSAAAFRRVRNAAGGNQFA